MSQIGKSHKGYGQTDQDLPPEVLFTSSGPVQTSAGGRHYCGAPLPFISSALYCALGASCRWLLRVAVPITICTWYYLRTFLRTT